MKIKPSSFYIRKLTNMLREPSKKAKIVWIFTIGILLAVNWGLIFNLGDFIGVIYLTSIIPMIIAAVVFKTKGGVLTGLVGGVLLLSFTPIFPLLEERIFFANLVSWASVSGSLVLMGVFIGGIFEMFNNQIKELTEVSLYDSSSNLPNRSNLIKRVDTLIEEEETEDISIILLDIENYEEIMNSIGHTKWGEFLKEIATQLKERQEIKFNLNGKKYEGRDMEINVYHIYNNKLGFLILNASETELTDLIEGLKDNTEFPFYYKKIPIYLDSHLGVASYQKGDQAVELFLHAYQAKNTAIKEKKKVKIYEKVLAAKELESFMLLGEVRKALDEDEFELYYMPKVSLQSNKITGVEALIRWQHPEQGNISPGKFIPLVEKTGIINELTDWVINRSAEEKKLLENRGIDVNMAVNITARNLEKEGFVEDLKNIIVQNGLDPAQFELELTETDIIEGFLDGNKSLNKLRKEGIKTSMDDFGTGYSSLTYLNNLDFNILKIDLSFVKAMQKNKKSYEIVKTAIKLGQDLGMEVVAEGIENQEAMEMLINLGCDYGQGYYLGKPIPREEFVDFYNSW